MKVLDYLAFHAQRQRQFKKQQKGFFAFYKDEENRKNYFKNSTVEDLGIVGTFAKKMVATTDKGKLNNALAKAGKPLMAPPGRTGSIKKVGGNDSL